MITHAEARAAVFAMIAIVAKAPNISELDLVAALEKRGFSHLHAQKICAFVPSAFAWALLKRMGLQEFPDHYITLDATGREIKLPISGEHYFREALLLAYETLERGWNQVLTKENFQTVAFRSAEIGAVNKLLNSGASVAKARLLPLRVFRIPAELAKEAL